MKAIVCNQYGSPDVLELKEIKKPFPTENQVLVKVHSASLNFGNLVLLKGKPFLARFAFGLTKPKYSIPGGDIAGTVEAVGKNVQLFKVGDKVFGDLSGCGWGGFAEYVTAPEYAFALKILAPTASNPSGTTIRRITTAIKTLTGFAAFFKMLLPSDAISLPFLP